ncbi:MAG: ergothioneine biosynthesis protein EgtC [Gammaproteobacteria bacterium]|nr:ergothioneine biosynthesis protein EgtC [Gammaproteobacteria bacterium]
MCRLAAYLGPEISLGRFLMEPDHSLYRQSWEPGEMEEAVLNADGFGFAWLNPSKQIAIYTDTRPIWSDTNLGSLCESLFSPYWLANVRSATPGQQITQSNTHPFKIDQILFTHNGYIEDFNPKIRAIFHEILDASIQAEIQGNTDSEYLFALLRQQLLQTPDIAEAFPAIVSTLSEIISDEKVLLNLIVGDGTQFYVLRHAINGQCPTLYYSTEENDFPDSILIASEALTESGKWQAVPEHRGCTISDNTPPNFISL